MTATSSAHPMGWTPMATVQRRIMAAAAPQGGSGGPPAGPPTVAQEIQNFTDWNEWLVAAGGLVETMDAVLKKTIASQPAQTAIDAVCHTFYDAASGMNAQIVAAIKGLEANPPVQPSVTFSPIDLPAWPNNTKPDLFSSVWSTASPMLQMLVKSLSAKDPQSPVVLALAGLINAGESIVQTLDTYYPSWGKSGAS